MHVLITLEGIDGTGKSTLHSGLGELLVDLPLEVLTKCYFAPLADY